MTDENSIPAEEQAQEPTNQPDDQQAAFQQPDPAQAPQAYQQPDLAQAQAYQQAIPADGQFPQAYQQAAPAYQQAVPMQGQPAQAYQQAAPMQGQPQQAYQQPPQGYQQQPQFYQQPGAQAPYGQPMPQAWGQPPAPPKNNRSTAALVCGILAIVLSPTVIAGIALGIVALVLVLTPKGQPRDGKAKAGMICGIAGLALSVVVAVAVAVIYYAAVQEAERLAAIEAARVPLSEEIGGTVIADDAVCTMVLNEMSIDADGNLNIYFTATNHAAKELTLSTPSTQAWDLNGAKVECIAWTWIKPGETKTDYFTIPASYMMTDDVEEVESLSGVLEADLKTGVPMEYFVDLY